MVTAAGGRRASGISIDPEQLTRMRDLYPMSREALAERTGELLFDRDWFAGVLAGRVPPDARLARALWLALDCEPGELIPGLPDEMTASEVPRWLRGNPGWSLSPGAIRKRAARRDWTEDDLAAAVSRHWFSRDSVNKIERGERRPKAATLEAFCKVLGCRPADLMPGSRELPEGPTRIRRELLDWNEGMRTYADSRGISYRTDSGRIRYPPGLREEYERWLDARDGVLASLLIRGRGREPVAVSRRHRDRGRYAGQRLACQVLPGGLEPGSQVQCKVYPERTYRRGRPRRFRRGVGLEPRLAGPGQVRAVRRRVVTAGCRRLADLIPVQILFSQVRLPVRGDERVQPGHQRDRGKLVHAGLLLLQRPCRGDAGA